MQKNNRITETTRLHHPSVPESVWCKWLNEKDCGLLVTLCCNSAHHIPIWAWKNYGLTITERRCNKCGALVVISDKIYLELLNMIDNIWPNDTCHEDYLLDLLTKAVDEAKKRNI